MKAGSSWLIGRFSRVVREVNRANAVMRVPEMRVRYSSPATPDEMEERRRRWRG